MKIVNARVDERLIHGQVAMVWTNTLGVDRIVVVNDDVPKDDMQIAALKIAKPPGVRLSLLSKERAITRFKDASYQGQRVFLITKTVEDMAFLAKHIELKVVNVGNVAAKSGSIAIKKSVSLTDEERKMIMIMIQSGIRVTAQMLPTESDTSIETFFN